MALLTLLNTARRSRRPAQRAMLEAVAAAHTFDAALDARGLAPLERSSRRCCR